MEKNYDPATIEQHWYNTWEDAQHFSPNGKDADTYCIMIPPPNVTGSLHMGHAFQDTLMDILIRHNRMKGSNTLWQVGTDHAGIATQMVVERQLNQQDLTRHDLGRESFVEKVWDWKAESGGTITQQLRRMGASVDWSRERFTMDEGLSKAVQEVFVKLYDEGLIYRGKRLVNWDPVLHTAVSDLEVISTEEKGHLWHIQYPVVGQDTTLTVATTRPETMLGDTAVAVHPEDPRYQSLIGKSIRLPLCDREIPIIADDYVDPEFGSGCVKITPAHDFNDYAVGQRHNLPMINIFTIDACLNDNVPECYQGMERFAAREQIIQDLTAQGRLEKIEDHLLKTPKGDRSGTVIEPFLTDQWFVKVEDLAKPAIQAVENGDIRFVPDNWKNTYYEWMHNIQDWCISRQLWWGHRIPAWYDAEGQVYVGHSIDDVIQKYNLPDNIELKQDDDVLDTWFSSALWPFSTLGWPENTEELKRFYPTSVLVTGFDIIFFWVARMIMMGLKFTGEIPFKDVYIHGLIRDAEGQKMSKSKGNVLDPIDLIDGITLNELVSKRTKNLMRPNDAPKIEKATKKHFPEGIPAFGTDSLRFTFAALASTGRDIRFDMNRIAGYRNFCNKLWNAARYTLTNLESISPELLDTNTVSTSVADRWIRSEFNACVSKIENALENYRFDLAAQALYEFIWHELCDWYLELSKPVLYDNNLSDAQKAPTYVTLYTVLEATLRLAHPFIPFITEEIWQRLIKLQQVTKPSIMLEPYPKCSDTEIDDEASDQIAWLKKIISSIRNIRGEMGIPPSQSVELLIKHGSDKDQVCLEAHSTLLEKNTKIKTVSWIADDHPVPPAATAVVDNLELFIPLASFIDKSAETQRLEKEIAKWEKVQKTSKGKLSNESFTQKAPKAVVEKENSILNEATNILDKLTKQLETIRQL